MLNSNRANKQILNFAGDSLFWIVCAQNYKNFSPSVSVCAYLILDFGFTLIHTIFLLQEPLNFFLSFFFVFVSYYFALFCEHSNFMRAREWVSERERKTTSHWSSKYNNLKSHFNAVNNDDEIIVGTKLLWETKNTPLIWVSERETNTQPRHQRLTFAKFAWFIFMPKFYAHTRSFLRQLDRSLTFLHAMINFQLVNFCWCCRCYCCCCCFA